MTLDASLDLASTGFAYLLVAALGGVVGFSELVSRYRDEPGELHKYAATRIYCAINAFTAVLALAIARASQLNFGFDDGADVIYWLQILAAGSSAMVLLRASFANVRVNGVDVAVGPQAFLDALQASADRQVDRRRAVKRDAVVAPLMKGVNFETAATVLPTYCFQLLQNSSPGEVAAVGASVRQYRDDKDIPDEVKARLLALLLLPVVGESVLTDAMKSLRGILVLPLPSSLSAPAPEELGPRGQDALRRLGDVYQEAGDAGASAASLLGWLEDSVTLGDGSEASDPATSTEVTGTNSNPSSSAPE